MAIVLLLAFIITPIVEIAVLIEVGGVIGLWPTLGIVIVTAVAGTWLLRMQGLATLRRAQESLARNRFPMQEAFDGMCLLFAGALLLTPGFVTDSIGLLLFVPPLRIALRRLIWRYLQASDKASIWIEGEEVRPNSTRDAGTIEGRYAEVPGDEDDGSPPRRSAR